MSTASPRTSTGPTPIVGAVPTKGPRGLMFRSRTEARWAYILDMMGWDWQYEPIDLQGYIPDFIVRFKNKDKESLLLLEVKGVMDLKEEESPFMIKLRKSGWKSNYVLVGAEQPRWGTSEWTWIGRGGVDPIADPVDVCVASVPGDQDPGVGVGTRWAISILDESTGVSPIINSHALFVKYQTDAQNKSQWFPTPTRLIPGPRRECNYVDSSGKVCSRMPQNLVGVPGGAVGRWWCAVHTPPNSDLGSKEPEKVDSGPPKPSNQPQRSQTKTFINTLVSTEDIKVLTVTPLELITTLLQFILYNDPIVELLRSLAIDIDQLRVLASSGTIIENMFEGHLHITTTPSGPKKSWGTPFRKTPEIPTGDTRPPSVDTDTTPETQISECPMCGVFAEHSEIYIFSSWDGYVYMRCDGKVTSSLKLIGIPTEMYDILDRYKIVLDGYLLKGDMGIGKITELLRPKVVLYSSGGTTLSQGREVLVRTSSLPPEGWKRSVDAEVRDMLAWKIHSIIREYRELISIYEFRVIILRERIEELDGKVTECKESGKPVPRKLKEAIRNKTNLLKQIEEWIEIDTGNSEYVSYMEEQAYSYKYIELIYNNSYFRLIDEERAKEIINTLK